VIAQRARFTEKQLADLAAAQHGVVSRRQLLEMGLGAAAISRRLVSGRLHAQHAGVYAVGHPVLGFRGRWMAAVLACGADAALGYRSAAVCWALQRDSSGAIDVVVPGTAGRGRDGIRVHRHPGLAPDEVTTREGIPVTTAARTILDLAAVAGDRLLKYALDQAEIQELTDYPALADMARAHPRHRGSRRLRDVLATYEAGTARTRSGLEVAFLALCDAHGLPRPLVNHELLTGQTVDFVFPDHRLAVETDSWRWHRGRQAFERDRERDARLAAAGYRTLRFTDRQIERAPGTVVRALAAAMRSAA
jgi:uncharacterized protein DUF559/putative AbiEi antitoxin of type IV toxin-antitoxin system